MSTMIANRILLVGGYRYIERPCGTAITPGMLVEVNSSGNAIPHGTEAGVAERGFALEDALQGKTTADAYAPATGTPGTAAYVGPDPVRIALAKPGTEVNALLGAGYSYTRGQTLVSGGNGTLIPESAVPSGTTVRQVIAVVLMPPGGSGTTALDLSASGAVNTLNPVRVL